MIEVSIFSPTRQLQDRESMVTLLVGARYGVSQVVNHKLSILSTLTEFTSITRIELLPESDKVSLVKIYLQDIKVRAGIYTHITHLIYRRQNTVNIIKKHFYFEVIESALQTLLQRCVILGCVSISIICSPFVGAVYDFCETVALYILNRVVSFCKFFDAPAVWTQEI